MVSEISTNFGYWQGLEFNNSAEATMQFIFTDNQPSWLSRVGLDGIYRMALWDYTLPVGQRGYRADSQTFILEYDRIAYREAYILQMHFEGNRMVMEAKERTCQSSVRFEGRLQKR